VRRPSSHRKLLRVKLTRISLYQLGSYRHWRVETGRANWKCVRGQLKCDDTRAETRFRPSVKRTSPFKSTEALVQSTAGSRGVRISDSNAEYTMFRGSVKSTGYPLHSPVSPSLLLPCVTCAIIFQLGSTHDNSIKPELHYASCISTTPNNALQPQHVTVLPNVLHHYIATHYTQQSVLRHA